MEKSYLFARLSRWAMAVGAVVVLAGSNALGQRADATLPAAENPPEERVCGTTDKYTAAEAQALPWYGNNQYLVNFLRKRGVAIAPDYVTRLLTAKPGEAGLPTPAARPYEPSVRCRKWCRYRYGYTTTTTAPAA